MSGPLRLPLALSAALLVGCAGAVDQGSGRGTGPAPLDARAGAELAARDELPLTPTTGPEQTQRAREIYLSGVRLLASSPPQVDAAIHEFQQALSIDPRFYRAHFKLGICYYQKGHYDLEINEYRKCLAINPAYVPASLNLGHAHLAKDELELARRAYQEVLDREPKHATALYNCALVEFDLGHDAESLRLFEKFVLVDGSGEMGERAREYIEVLRVRLRGQ